MLKITEEEYNNALHTVALYEYHQRDTKQVSVTYKAEVSVTVQVPNSWTTEKILKELACGAHHGLEHDSGEEISFGAIIELIVAGEEIKL